jgi:hypothetical protein
MLKRCLKALHEISAVGVLGCFASCLVLIATTDSIAGGLRSGSPGDCRDHALAALIPSLVLVSGLLGIAANPAFHSAGWAWLKALLGISMFEGTLLTVGASARHAAVLSALAASGSGSGDPAPLAEVLRTEWGGCG